MGFAEASAELCRGQEGHLLWQPEWAGAEAWPGTAWQGGATWQQAVQVWAGRKVLLEP